MVLSTSDVVTVIKQAGTQIDLTRLDENAILSEIGADSLDMMNILLGVQELTGQEIRDEDVHELRSVKAICDYVNGMA
ncbi:MAG: acyl carrier protein [Rhizobiales bacterium]|nr:acyl carrier protein [Hyphomicrobiales bacterium]